MQYERVYRDLHSDPTTVVVKGEKVHVSADEGGIETTMHYTPDQARELAAVLIEAADVAEGNG